MESFWLRRKLVVRCTNDRISGGPVWLCSYINLSNRILNNALRKELFLFCNSSFCDFNKCPFVVGILKTGLFFTRASTSPNEYSQRHCVFSPTRLTNCTLHTFCLNHLTNSDWLVVSIYIGYLVYTSLSWYLLLTA